MFEAEDFGDEFTPEARAQEERIREQLEAQQSSIDFSLCIDRTNIYELKGMDHARNHTNVVVRQGS